MRSYQNLVKEGKDDIDFFKGELKIFQQKLAQMAFKDLQLCETIQETIDLLRKLVSVCQIHQRYLERMENSEYKAYLAELRIHCEYTQEPEEQPGTSDNKPSIFKRKITWIAEG